MGWWIAIAVLVTGIGTLIIRHWIDEAARDGYKVALVLVRDVIEEMGVTFFEGEGTKQKPTDLQRVLSFVRCRIAQIRDAKP